MIALNQVAVIAPEQAQCQQNNRGETVEFRRAYCGMRVEE
jgi:hypothetical protein